MIIHNVISRLLFIELNFKKSKQRKRYFEEKKNMKSRNEKKKFDAHKTEYINSGFCHLLVHILL